MIFSGYFNYTYIVKELSFKQAEWLLAQQSAEKKESIESISQLLNRPYSYRTYWDINH